MVIHEFRKNARSKVRIELIEYRGAEIIGIRVWFLVPGTKDDWRPTRKGISLDICHLEELAKGIVMAAARAYKKKSQDGQEEFWPGPC